MTIEPQRVNSSHPETPGSARTLTQAELVSEARRLFGNDPSKWAFRCPRCDDVATAQDFRAAGADPNRIGQECVGRHCGALAGPPSRDGRGQADRGCDWAAYGLLSGPWHILLPDGREIPSFPLAANISGAA